MSFSSGCVMLGHSCWVALGHSWWVGLCWVIHVRLRCVGSFVVGWVICGGLGHLWWVGLRWVIRVGLMWVIHVGLGWVICGGSGHLWWVGSHWVRLRWAGPHLSGWVELGWLCTKMKQFPPPMDICQNFCPTNGFQERPYLPGALCSCCFCGNCHISRKHEFPVLTRGNAPVFGSAEARCGEKPARALHVTESTARHQHGQRDLQEILRAGKGDAFLA